MKYILNEIPIKTTNSFNINNIKVDINLDNNISYDEYITNNKDINIKYEKSNDFNTLLGFNYKKCLKLNIDINKEYKEDIIFIYNSKDTLINEININCNNAKANIIFKYESNNNCILKQNINLNNSNINITNINLLDNNKIFILENISNLYNSILNQNLIDIGSNIKIINYKSIINKNSESNINNLYIGCDNNKLDMVFNYINNNEFAKANIKSIGILNDKAIKNNKLNIEFKSNAFNSIGKENEDVTILSDDVTNRSAPILLCNCDNVIGEHSVSSGMIDDKILYYLKSRGISYDNALKLILYSKYNKIVSNINNLELEEEIIKYINEKIL